MKDKSRSKWIVILGIASMCLLGAMNSYAAFYQVKIAQIVPRSASGDVFVQFDPGATETRFTERARGVLLGTDAGTNKVMAVLLTAVTLGAEVTILVDNVPTFTDIQVIQSAGLVAP